MRFRRKTPNPLGRLRVFKRRHGQPVVYVMPNEGGRPLELPVRAVSARSAIGEGVTVVIEVWAHSIDIEARQGRVHGRPLDNRPAVFPDLQFHHPMAGLINCFSWDWRVDDDVEDMLMVTYVDLEA